MSTERNRGDPTQTILDCIDKGLDVFGASVKTVVYWGFEHDYGMEKRDVVTKPELFCNHMRDIFGQGSEIVERRIGHELRKAFGLEDVDKYDLTLAIKMIRSEFSRW